MNRKIVAGFGVVAMIAAAAPAGAGILPAETGAPRAFILAQAEGPAETEEQLRLRLEAEAAAKAAEEEARRQAEEAAKAAEQEAARQAEEAQRQAEEAARAAEQEAARQAEEAQRQAEEAARAAEDEARRQAEQAQREAEEAARQQAEEAKRQADEAERAAAEETQRQQEEQRRQAEEEQRQADEAARAAEQEAAKQAEEAAQAAAEEEERKRREAEAQAAQESQPAEPAQPEGQAAVPPSGQAAPAEQPAQAAEPAAPATTEQQQAEQPAEAAPGETAPQEAAPARERRDRRRENAGEQPPAESPQQAEQAPAGDVPAAGAPAAAEQGTRQEQQQAVEEAKQPAAVSEQAAQPKDIVEQRPVEEIVKQAEQAPPAVVPQEMTREERRQLREAEGKRRERERERRDETIGAALTGAVIGALIPQLGGVVAADEGDRIIVERDGRYFVRKDDSALFRDDAEDIRYERLRGGLVREIVTRPNGSQIITIRDAGGNLLRRERITRNGDLIVLFDTRIEEVRRPYAPIIVPQYTIEIPRESYIVSARRADRELVYETLAAEPVYTPPQRYTLRDIRENAEVRQLVRRVDLDTVTFETGSSYVSETQIRLLGDIAGGMLDLIDRDPSAVFLIEGHTDAVGSDLSNLALSDRRAETVARILSEAYDIPPENLVVQGYGEQFLKVRTQAAERANRRVTVRNISPILQGAAEQ